MSNENETTQTKTTESTTEAPAKTESLLAEETSETPEDKTSLVDAAEETSDETSEESDETTSEDDGDESETEETTAEPLTAEAFTIPEGLDLDESGLSDALEIINNPKLSQQEVGKQLIDMQIKATQEAMDAADTAGNAAWDEMQTKWQDDAKALPKLGGDNLQKTLTTIKAGLKRAGASKETFEALTLTGAGNHPEIIRVLHALTAPLAEGKPTQGSVTSPNLSQAERIFGASN